MLKFLVKVFVTLDLLKFELDLADTVPDIRYYSIILCCTIPIPLTNLEIKVTHFEILRYSFLLKFLEVYIA